MSRDTGTGRRPGAASSDAFHPTVAQIEHIALATNDVECLCDFYQQLGATASPPSTDPDTGLRKCVLDFCGVRLELFERPGRREGAVGDAPAPGLMLLGLALGSADAVDELSRVIAAMRALSSTPTATGSSSPFERPGDAWNAPPAPF